MRIYFKTPALVINLSDYESYEIQAQDDSTNDTKAENTCPKILVKTHSAPLNQNSVAPITIGGIPLNAEQSSLKGTITIESLDPEFEKPAPIEGFVDKITMKFDADAVNSLFPDGKFQISFKSDLFSLPIAENIPVRYDLEQGTEEQPAEIVLSRILSFENEDGETELMAQYILPDHDDDNSAFPTSIKKEGGSNWNFSFDLNHTDDGAFVASTEEAFEVSILEGNKLIKEVRRFIEKYIAEHPAPEPKNVDFIDEVIGKLKNHDPIRTYIQESYGINLYNPDVLNFVKVEDVHEINLDKKTLILIPGTFKKSLESAFAIDGTHEWEGSFKYLMKETGGEKNWFQYLLRETEFEQIISIEHDSTVDSLADNIQYFIDYLGLGTLKFEQPTAVLSASRGGYLAKKLALVGADQDMTFNSSQLNLNIEKIITVANGHSDYVDISEDSKHKKAMQFLLKVMSFGKFGGAGQFLWLYSLKPRYILRLPGLRSQSKNSAEVKAILSNQVPGLWCLPLANNFRSNQLSLLRIVEKKFADDILGPENDLVLSFESQQKYTPGQLLNPFTPILGTARHGRGLKKEAVRKALIPFLKAESAVDTDTELIEG